MRQWQMIFVLPLIWTCLLLYGTYKLIQNGGHRLDASSAISSCNSTFLSGGVSSDDGALTRSQCPTGFFLLPGMEKCHPLLNCTSIQNDITLGKQIWEKSSKAKEILKGRWRGLEVIVSIFKTYNIGWTDDFLNGVKLLRIFQPSEHVVQLVGACGLTYVTQFHSLGNAEQLHSVLESDAYKKNNTIQTRFKVCVSYVKAINFLHTSPMGTRVMCDSRDLGKALSQFLLTPDLDLVLNDLDLLPEVNTFYNLTTPCKKIPFLDSFNAPEQFLKNRSFDEKTDIWKIPDVCNFFLGPWNQTMKEGLQVIHSKCKEVQPSKRPSAEEVLFAYTKVLDKLNKRRR